MSLLSLGLCPSASLVIPRQTGQSSSGGASGVARLVTGQPSVPTGQTGPTAGQSSVETGPAGSATGQPSLVTGPTPSATGTSPRIPGEYSESLPTVRHGVGHVLGSGERNAAGEMDIERSGVEIQPSEQGVNDDIHHDRIDEVMEDEAHSHSDDEEMESEPDDDNAMFPAPILPPAHFNLPPRPNFGLPFPPHLRRPPGAPPMNFPVFPPLGRGRGFVGEGRRLGGKEVAIIGDAQLIREEGGKCVT